MTRETDETRWTAESRKTLSEIMRRLGRKTSPAKAAASRINGRKAHLKQKAPTKKETPHDA